MSTVLVEREDHGGVALVRLNRPAARNALSVELRASLDEELLRLQADDAVRAIVLTGADPAFSAGVDLKELVATPEIASDIGPRTAPVLRSGKPLIGAVNGAAYTGGLELALACHWLIASERATFADTHARLGMLPGWGLSVLLTEAVGSRRARQLAMTGEPIDADRAYRWGLVNEVVPHDLLLRRAVELARAGAAGEPTAMARTVRLYDDQASVRDAAAWLLEARAWLLPGSSTPVGGPEQR